MKELEGVCFPLYTSEQLLDILAEAAKDEWCFRYGSLNNIEKIDGNDFYTTVRTALSRCLIPAKSIQ